MVICLECGANDLHYGPADATATPSSLASLKSTLVIGLTLLVPAYPDCPGNEAIKWVSVLYCIDDGIFFHFLTLQL